jgi:Xaa-Pro aminopeptidase
MSSFAQRLEQLRQLIKAAGLDGFVLDRADAFQGEEVRPCDERLAWMTGFDGSAGTAVILADKAALFSDSRYSLQLERQLDSTLWQGFDTAEKGLADWLAAQAAPARLTLGYASETTTPARLRRWQKISGRLDWQALPAHPVDPIWTDRPAPAPRAVWQVPDHLAGQTAAEKLAALREKMAAGGAQAQLVTDPMAVNWLFNLRGNDLAHTPVHLCFALIPEQGQPVLIGAEAGAASLAGAEGVALSDAGKMLASLSGQKLALDRASCPLLIADLASSSGAEIVWQEDPLIGMKACKNSAELAGFHAAHLQDALAFVEFWHWLEQQDVTGFTESQLADQLQQYRAAKPGYICDSFPAIVGFAENAAVVHYRARPGQDRQITADNLLLIDSGGHYQQGTTDITRTLAIGSPPAEAVAAASSVLAGHCELARARFPAQSSGAQLDALARAPLWEKQLDYGHGTGHGVGHILSVHEGPVSLSPRSDKPVQAGMVLSNEPGYYQPGSFGVRQENLVAVEQADAGWLKLAPLTLVPFDRRLADPAFFSTDQLAWLNQYHRSVEAALRPHLPASMQGWLAEKCAPIGDW